MFSVGWGGGISLPLVTLDSNKLDTFDQSVANIYFLDRIRIQIYSECSFIHEYEYEYIWYQILDRTQIRIYSGWNSGPNMNKNIFRIKFWTEYEYKYIRNQILDRIRIRIRIRIFIIQSLWSNSRYLTSCDSIYWLNLDN